MALQFKPLDKQARMIFTYTPGKAFPEHVGKLFAIIGPFDGNRDKIELQKALELVCRDYNITSKE